MQMQSIKIQNFKSIKELTIELDDFNIFVGQNNHGKTNFFEAINWFFNGFGRGLGKNQILCAAAKDSDDIIVDVKFRGLQDAIANMSNATKQKALKTIFGEEQDSVTIKRTTEFDSGKKRQLQKPSDEWENTMGADSTWNDLLPQLEYIHTKLSIDDVSGYKSNSPISEMLSGVLTAIIEDDPRYKDLQNKFGDLFGNEKSEVRAKLNDLSGQVEIYLKKQFPDDTKVNFNVEIPQFNDLLKGFSTEIHDGVLTPVEEKGDGMQRAVMLAIIQAYAEFRKKNFKTRNFVFLIDEAELHLHPSAQRALLQALSDITDSNDQVAVNTHSSVLVTADFEQKLFGVEKLARITHINEVKSPDDRMNVIFDLLGGSPADLLLPKNIIIVEGQSEFEFINEIRRRHYPEIYNGIKVIFARGDIERQKETYHAIHEAYKPLMVEDGIYKNRVVIMCDAPNATNQTHYDDFLRTHTWIEEGEQLQKLPVDALEKYYPEPYKKDNAGIEQLVKDRAKKTYALEVAKAISKSDFETHMPVVRATLEKALELSFTS